MDWMSFWKKNQKDPPLPLFYTLLIVWVLVLQDAQDDLLCNYDYENPSASFSAVQTNLTKLLYVYTHTHLVSALILQIQQLNCSKAQAKSTGVSAWPDWLLLSGLAWPWKRHDEKVRLLAADLCPAIIHVSHKSTCTDALRPALVISLWSSKQKKQTTKSIHALKSEMKNEKKKKSPRHCFRVREFSLSNISSCSRGRSYNIFILI